MRNCNNRILLLLASPVLSQTRLISQTIDKDKRYVIKKDPLVKEKLELWQDEK